MCFVIMTNLKNLGLKRNALLSVLEYILEKYPALMLWLELSMN
jgi:hypothetical protein